MSNNLQNKYFKIIIINNIIELDYIRYNTFDDLFISIYTFLFEHQKINLTDIQVICYYMNIPVTKFNIAYRNGLILYNNENYIKISSIYPEYNAIDNAFGKIYDLVQKSRNKNVPMEYPETFSLNRVKSDSQIDIIEDDKTDKTDKTKKIILSNTENHNNKKKILKNIKLNKTKNIVHLGNDDVSFFTKQKKSISTSNACDGIFCDRKLQKDSPQQDIHFVDSARCPIKQLDQNKKNIDNTKQEELNEELDSKNEINKKIRIFESDKRSYILMKNDIDSGIFKIEQMHPYFFLKYQIFKILDQRGKINLDSNNNIDQEYELFYELYAVCNEQEENNMEDKKEVCKVYIPHNYHYMTSDKKEEHAKKYNMTRQYFEDKYINRVIDDDVIEKHINAQIQSESEEDIKIKNIIIDANIKSPNISDEEFNTKSDNPEKNIF